jgi:addiction module RelE/StbE family toxin
MIEIAFSSSFKRALKKVSKNKTLEKKFWDKTELFIQDPFNQSLRTHKLSGKLSQLWSFTVDYDLRVIFYFENSTHVVFIDIGTHNEVY